MHRTWRHLWPADHFFQPAHVVPHRFAYRAQPIATGILNTGSIGTFTGTSLDYAALLNAQVDLASAKALTASSGYVTTAAVAKLLMARQEFAGPTGNALWQGSILDGKVGGLRAMSSEQVPAATMILGNWADVVIGEWGVLEISINNAADFPKGITGVRCMYTMDVGVRNAAAFSAANSIT
jgi:HK97 family phage major capsid protein